MAPLKHRICSFRQLSLPGSSTSQRNICRQTVKSLISSRTPKSGHPRQSSTWLSTAPITTETPLSLISSTSMVDDMDVLLFSVKQKNRPTRYFPRPISNNKRKFCMEIFLKNSDKSPSRPLKKVNLNA